MFAVFESGGKQHRVTEGEVVELELLDAAPGEAVEFDKVMSLTDGADTVVGAPYVGDARVRGEVVGHDRGDKVRIYKFRRRKNYRRQGGHRQWFTSVKITGIQK
jgi:large subunit ribosomal protein L21